MKSFFKKIFVLVLIVVLIDISFSKILDYGRPKEYQQFISSKKQFKYYKDSVEILFFGDSHIADAVVPSIIENTTSLCSFNFGVYHLSPIEGYYLLKDILKRSPNIRVVVLGTNPLMLTRDVSEGKYTPLFINNVFHLLQLYLATSTNNLGKITRTGKKTDLIIPLINKVFKKDKASEVRKITEIDQGYLKNIKCFSKLEELNCNKNSFSKSQNELQKEYFIKTIQLLKTYNIEVIIVNLPLHNAFLNDARNTKAFKEFSFFANEISNKNDILYFNENYEVLSGKLEDKDFLNGEHLCYSGARKFSLVLSQFINEVYNFE